MCYYSASLRSDQFRAAKEGENLVLGSPDGGSHTVAFSDTEAGGDGKVVCILNNTQVHIEKLVLNPPHRPAVARSWPHLLMMEGKPVSCRFHERHERGYSYDSLLIDCDGIRQEVHFAYLMHGMKFYLGTKRPDVVKLTGVDDPSIALDHRTDEPVRAPTRDMVDGD